MSDSCNRVGDVIRQEIGNTKKFTLFLLIIGLSILASQAQAAAISFYTDKTTWSSNVAGFVTEDFNDATLNSDVSVITDVGTVANGKWEDRLTPSGDSTTFSFTPDILAFGGDWFLAGPGGEGTGIALTATFFNGGDQLLSQEIPSSTAGGFWGFVSDTEITDVLLTSGTQSGSAETFHLDNMVYSPAPVPIPAAAWLFGSGLLGLFGIRKKSK